MLFIGAGPHTHARKNRAGLTISREHPTISVFCPPDRAGDRPLGGPLGLSPCGPRGPMRPKWASLPPPSQLLVNRLGRPIGLYLLAH
jgi:hypothetical protein